ncbi:YqjF family protein [Agromyces sp. Soil535]|uniref:YqjF family protein n=1 Tax=Agromyces sp. Soil535 TaxID=1736390 RepID=UPI000A8B33AA|nr:DUF2071 domain-containing protein [Agromyces sp. Soil535]
MHDHGRATDRPGRFLTGGWTDLAMLNFACPAELLEPLVPSGTELDAHAGTPQVSLVGFMFRDTRVHGVPVPFHRHFEEVNLRFYVRRVANDGVRRGVVFVKELVPRWAIAAAARALYQERYVAVPMEHRVDVVDGAIPTGGVVEYRWTAEGGPFLMRCVVSGPAREIVEGSEEEFITEHYWGYAAQRDGGTVEYEVEHPRWRVHPVGDRLVEGDLASLYGPAFGEVLAAPPTSAFVATGSPIVVRRGRRLPD